MFNWQRKAICVLQKRPSGHTDLCVSAGGPWGDEMCGRTCHSRGSPWERIPGCAHDAGAEMPEWSPSPSPLLHRRLQRIQGGRDQWKCFECQFQGGPHTQTSQLTQLKFFPLLCLSFIVPIFFFSLKCVNATQSQMHQTGSRDGLTECWHLISFSIEIPQSWDTPSTQTPWKPPTPFLCPPVFFFFLFYPSYHHSHYAYAGLQWNKKKEQCKIRQKESTKKRKIL